MPGIIAAAPARWHRVRSGHRSPGVDPPTRPRPPSDPLGLSPPRTRVDSGAPRRGRSCPHVRTVHRPRTSRCRPGPGRGPDAQPQLHRHRAHPARADPRGRRRRRQGARVPRHLPRRRAPAGRGDHRPGPAGAERAHPVHPAGQEGARALPARGAAARPQLHRHRAHPARPDPRGRGRRRPGAGQARRRPEQGPPAGHPAAQRLPEQGAGRRRPPRRRRRRRWCSTSSAAT